VNCGQNGILKASSPRRGFRRTFGRDEKGSAQHACLQLAAIMKFRIPNLGTSTGAKAGSAAVCPGKWILLLLFCAVFCFGTRGTGLSAHRVGAFGHGPTATHFAIADFDGDNRPDLATVETGLIGASHARYWIGFRMSAGARQTIGVNAPVGGLEIASRDVNGDNIIDLVVSTAWLKSPVAVLVNDGHGNFTIRDPAAFSSALINPSQTLDSPSKQNPDEALAISSRSSDDFVATERATAIRSTSQKILTRNSLRNVFPLVVRSSGRAPPPSVHHV
jgi:hypothetical protein